MKRICSEITAKQCRHVLEANSHLFGKYCVFLLILLCYFCEGYRTILTVLDLHEMGSLSQLVYVSSQGRQGLQLQSLTFHYHLSDICFTPIPSNGKIQSQDRPFLSPLPSALTTRSLGSRYISIPNYQHVIFCSMFPYNSLYCFTEIYQYYYSFLDSR